MVSKVSNWIDSYGPYSAQRRRSMEEAMAIVAVYGLMWLGGIIWVALTCKRSAWRRGHGCVSYLLSRWLDVILLLVSNVEGTISYGDDAGIEVKSGAVRADPTCDRINEILPQYNFNMLIVGRSGTGKTTLHTHYYTAGKAVRTASALIGSTCSTPHAQ